jgi:phage terminase large subunit-like protein
MTQQSAIVETLTELARLGAAERGIDELTELELAALGATWGLWERPNQAIPPAVVLADPPREGERWPEWGRTWPGQTSFRWGAFIGRRGTGKTAGILAYIHQQAMSLRWRRILLVAQGEKEAIKIFVKLPHGLIEGAPPWERPYYTASTGGKGGVIVWPSGAEATITCCGAKFEEGPEYNGAWCTEVRSWAHNRRVETWGHVQAVVRQPPGEILVDSPPRQGHPILEAIKDAAEVDKSCWWVRHRKADNRLFLIPGYYEQLTKALAGTRMYDEDVEGKEAAECGIVKTAWIEAARRHLPSAWVRRIVVLDPARTDPAEGKTATIGLVGMGQGTDQQLYVTEDRSGLMAPEGEGCWPQQAVDMYIAIKADCMVIEKNSGGRLNAALIRFWAAERGWRVVIVQLEAKTRAIPGTINIKEVHAREDKATRFELGAKLYHDGEVSHVIDADLDGLETTLTGWYPEKRGAQSPGDLDCVAWGCVEIKGYYSELRAEPGGQRALVKGARERQQQAAAERGRPVGRIYHTTDYRRDTRGRI